MEYTNKIWVVVCYCECDSIYINAFDNKEAAVKAYEYMSKRCFDAEYIVEVPICTDFDKAFCDLPTVKWETKWE